MWQIPAHEKRSILLGQHANGTQAFVREMGNGMVQDGKGTILPIEEAMKRVLVRGFEPLVQNFVLLGQYADGKRAIVRDMGNGLVQVGGEGGKIAKVENARAKANALGFV